MKETLHKPAVVITITLFAMIAFVTNLCSPMAIITKNQFDVSEFVVQIGSMANYLAYLTMGIPCGFLIVRYGYKCTTQIALIIGFLGVSISLLSGFALSFMLYLLGVFTSGLCMCMLNAIVNPLLNSFAGGGEKGNQLIQIGNSFNSAAAVSVYLFMGMLIGDIEEDITIADATPALILAAFTFIVAYVMVLFTRLKEPVHSDASIRSFVEVLHHRHFALGLIAIFLYLGLEVSIPTYISAYLLNLDISGSVSTQLASLYLFMMFIGRVIGGVTGGVISPRMMLSTASVGAILLILFAMIVPESIWMPVPIIVWDSMTIIATQVPISVHAMVLVGLFTSIMWGAIFNLSTESLGKHTALASGMFMTMVFGCPVVLGVQAVFAEFYGILVSYIIPLLCVVYILFYALYGSRIIRVKRRRRYNV